MTKCIVLVEGDDETPLPQGLMVQHMVALASAVNGENLSVLLQNETKREVTLPEDTLLVNMQVADMVVPPATECMLDKINPSLIDFGDSPIPVEWKKRLQTEMYAKKQ